MITLNKAEAEAVFELIDQMSGGNPENGFSWDGTDDMSNPTTSALFKIFKECGRNVPENLEVTPSLPIIPLPKW